MSPGTYLAKRRQAAGLSIDDVAGAVRTDPPVGEVDRAGWIRRIEENAVLPSFDVIHALGQLFPFSRSVLSELTDLHRAGSDPSAAPRLCMICACSDHDPCRESIGPGQWRACGWAAHDTCTRCVPTEEAA